MGSVEQVKIIYNDLTYRNRITKKISFSKSLFTNVNVHLILAVLIVLSKSCSGSLKQKNTYLVLNETCDMSYYRHMPQNDDAYILTYHCAYVKTFYNLYYINTSLIDNRGDIDYAKRLNISHLKQFYLI